MDEMIRASLLASFHQTPSRIDGVAVVARRPNAHRTLVTKNFGGLKANRMAAIPPMANAT